MKSTDMEAVETLCVRLESSAAAFREHTVYDSEGDPLRLFVQADEMTEAVETLRALLSAYQERGRDAERFQALMRCPQIKMQGSSGVDARTGERNGNGVHFGAEFWPYPPKPEYAHLDGGDASTKWGQACIRALADAILEEEARSALTPSGAVK